MKKGIQILLVLVILLSIVGMSIVGCAKEEAPAKPAPAAPAKPAPAKPAPAKPAPVTPAPVTPAPAKPAPAAPAPAKPAPAPEAEVTKWLWQTHHPSALLESFGHKRIRDKIEELSGGRLDITMYTLGALCPGADVFTSCLEGMFEFGLSDPGYHMGFMPECAVGPLPFALRNQEDVYLVWNYYGLGDLIRESYEASGVHFLGWTMDGEVILASTKSVPRASNYVGMKIRSPGTRAKWFDALGAATTYLPGDEVYGALATGVVEAATWGGEQCLLDWKWYEVAPFIIKPGVNIAQQGNDYYCNVDAWNELTPDLQGIVREVVNWFCVNQGAMTLYMDSQARVKLVEEFGCTIVHQPPKDYPVLAAAAEKIWQEVADSGPKAKEAVKIITDYMRMKGYTDFTID